MLFPTEISDAALAREFPVALLTKGTVREALGFASKTYSVPVSPGFVRVIAN